MNEIKFLEIRDNGTFLPMLAVRLDSPPEQSENADYLMRRAGWVTGQCPILLTSLHDGAGAFDPFLHINETRKIAHLYIERHWDELDNGQVVDVEYILGITDKPKKSERKEVPGW